MATWTNRGSTVGSPVNVTSDGTKIWWATKLGSTAGDDIYEYDPATFTITKILERTNITNLDDIIGLCAFNGDLYVYTTYSTGTPFEKIFRVQRWDGVDTLTTVDTVATHTYINGAAPAGRMYLDSDQLVAIFIAGATNSGSTCRYSSDGSTWATASFSVTPKAPSGGAVWAFPFASHHPLEIHETLCTSNTLGACTTYSTFKFTGAAWTVVSSDALKYYQGIVGTTKYWVTTGDDSYTTNFVSSTNAGGSATKIFQVSMPWHPGVIDTGSGTGLYQFDGANWVLFETIATFRFGTGDCTMVRLTSGDVFILGLDNADSSNRIIQRSEAISSTLCQFYQGTNTPTFKSDVPLPGVLPGAMAVSPDGQTVVLGANAVAAQTVVYAANPWASWSDMSGGYPSGTAVTSIKYT